MIVPNVRRISVQCHVCVRVFPVEIAASTYALWRDGERMEGRSGREPWPVPPSWCCTEDGRFVEERHP